MDIHSVCRCLSVEEVIECLGACLKYQTIRSIFICIYLDLPAVFIS